MDIEIPDTYQLVTDRFLKQLQQGIIPWHVPWTTRGLPLNLLTRKYYRGINVWLLNLPQYSTNCYISYDQIKEIGASIKPNELGNLLVYTAPGTDTLHVYHIYNIDQCNGIPKALIPIYRKVNDPVSVCDEILYTMPERIEIRNDFDDEAYYDEVFDFINMPKKESFECLGHYYHLLWFHLMHACLNFHRVKTHYEFVPLGKGILDKPKGILLAEMGAAYLSCFAGFEQSLFAPPPEAPEVWQMLLRNNPKMVVEVALVAQQAVDAVLGYSLDEDEVIIPIAANNLETIKRNQKVYYGFQGGTYEKKPLIRLCGKYLKKAGFRIGDNIQITLKNQKITISKL